MCSKGSAYPQRSSAIGTHALRPGSPKTYVTVWELHKTSLQHITHVLTDSRSIQTNGWNSTCDSGPTINRTTGQRTYQWRNLRITHGTMRQQRRPPSVYLWGTNHEPPGKSQSHRYPKSPHA